MDASRTCFIARSMCVLNTSSGSVPALWHNSIHNMRDGTPVHVHSDSVIDMEKKRRGTYKWRDGAPTPRNSQSTPPSPSYPPPAPPHSHTQATPQHTSPAYPPPVFPAPHLPKQAFPTPRISSETPSAHREAPRSEAAVASSLLPQAPRSSLFVRPQMQRARQGVPIRHPTRP